MDYLRKHLAEMKTTWAIDVAASKAAADAFGRGQRLLGEGDAHRAMSHFAMACRHHPGHPDYEATLAWVRFRVQVAAGRDQQEMATIERKLVDSQLQGCRPWPRALVALALLCAAGGDADSARWHLAIALSIDPNVPAAAQLAQRLRAGGDEARALDEVTGQRGRAQATSSPQPPRTGSRVRARRAPRATSRASAGGSPAWRRAVATARPPVRNRG